MRTDRELQALWEAQINFSIEPAADGFIVRLGDYLRGTDPWTNRRTVDDAVVWLREQVKTRYPASSYSRRVPTYLQRP